MALNAQLGMGLCGFRKPTIPNHDSEFCHTKRAPDLEPAFAFSFQRVLPQQHPASLPEHRLSGRLLIAIPVRPSAVCTHTRKKHRQQAVRPHSP